MSLNSSVLVNEVEVGASGALRSFAKSGCEMSGGVGSETGGCCGRASRSPLPRGWEGRQGPRRAAGVGLSRAVAGEARVFIWGSGKVLGTGLGGGEPWGEAQHTSPGGKPEESWTRAGNGRLVLLQPGDGPRASKAHRESGTGAPVPAQAARRMRSGQTHGRK